MDDVTTIYLLKKKGIYYFLTKYIMLLGYCLIVLVTLIDLITSDNIMFFQPGIEAHL